VSLINNINGISPSVIFNACQHISWIVVVAHIKKVESVVRLVDTGRDHLTGVESNGALCQYCSKEMNGIMEEGSPFLSSPGAVAKIEIGLAASR
jgi:hypothetical protein